MDSLASIFNQAKPFLAVIFLQFGYAGMCIISKFALNQGMSQHVLVVYRHAIATLVIAPFAIVLDRKVRPKMNLSIFVKILLLGLLEPTIDQNLYYTGMKYTTATFASAMCNVLPAFAFMMAWVFKLEKVNIRKLHSQAKVLGTIVTVGGAMLMTLINGPMLPLPWIKSNSQHEFSIAAAHQDPIKGSLMITIGCICWASFVILQAITLKSYPAELSLTALICFVGTIGGSIVALAMEAGNATVWSIHLDVKLLAAAYGGVICSGITYYVQGVTMKTRGPVFVTAFNPLSMVIVAILSTFVLSEILYLGRVIGAIVIVIGLYLVLWGKSKDQPSSNHNIKMEVSNDQKMTVMDEKTIVSIQDCVVLDLTCSKVTPTDESV
ncbi:WAT1-related protein At2g39510-like [Durio zibethinus]|uniref:WAT1-related protein n=1 Tax=Durio zibethinus TaxID=66656 RepID=A0A6P6AK14_DURZI|nr:WAT1-related protein At2g39510-like [Durio zibethinus]